MAWMGHSEEGPGEIAEEERRQIEHGLEARAEEGAQREERVRDAQAARQDQRIRDERGQEGPAGHRKRPLLKRVKRLLRGKGWR